MTETAMHTILPEAQPHSGVSGFGTYLKAVDQHELLGGQAQETALAQRIEAGLFASKMLLALEGEARLYEQLCAERAQPRPGVRPKNSQLLSPRELCDGIMQTTTTQVRRYQERCNTPEAATTALQQDLLVTKREGVAARERMIVANLRLVTSLARRQQPYREVSLEDLVQVGNMGLMHAVDKFDFTNRASFATYATTWIRKYIGEHCTQYDNRLGMCVPEEVALRLGTLAALVRRKEEASHAPPSTEEIMEHCSLNREAAEALLWYRHQLSGTRSLDQQMLPGGMDLLGQMTGNSPEQVLFPPDTGSGISIRYALGILNDPAQRRVLTARYGLDGRGPLSNRQAAQQLHMSPRRVTTLEEAALARLRQAVNR